MKRSVFLRLSFRAKTHRRAAIAALIVAKIALGVLGFNFGLWVALEGWQLPAGTSWLLAAFALAALLVYPARLLKKRLSRAVYYRRQKTLDGMLAALGFVFWFFAGNLSPVWTAAPVAGTPAVPTNPVTWSSLEKPLPEYRKEVIRGGKWKRWLATKAQARIARKIDWYKRTSRNIDDGGKVALTILVILLALLLAYLVAALSCSIACSGMEGLAILVAIAGAIGIVVGAFLAIRGIWYSREDRETDQRRQNKRAPTKSKTGE